MFLKNKQKAQATIEVIVILGVLIVGAVIIGSFYLSNQNKKTGEAARVLNTATAMNDDLNSDELYIPGTPIICGDGFIDGAEECEPGPPINVDGKTCESEDPSLTGPLNCYAVGTAQECTFDKTMCTVK